jgi:preprotein translocase subunit SecA
MLNFISKLFPSKHEKDVKEIRPIVDKINEYYEEYQKLTDEQLKEKTLEFKERIRNGAGDIENRILELQEKLKEDLSHDEIADISTEIDNLEDEYYETVKSFLDSLVNWRCCLT